MHSEITMILMFQTATIPLLRASASVFSWIWEFVKEPGGLIVLVGVIGELIFEYGKWPGDENRRGKLKRTCGLLLILGLVLEIPESAQLRKLAADANERAAKLEKQAANARLETVRLEKWIAETSANVTNIDPRNAPVSDMSATAILIVMGTDFNDLTNKDMHGRVATMSLWNNDKQVAPFDSLNANSFTRNDFWVIIGNPNSSNSREYGIRFNSFNFRAFNGLETPVKAIDDVRSVRIDTFFLPHGSRIAAGGINLVVNNRHKLFQIDTNRSNFENPGPPYSIFATNIDEPPKK
jgi:hypothetical protein